MIVSAAIRLNGEIHVGRTHSAILNAALPFGYLKSGEQGFTNHKGHFLNRKDALDHAQGCGQPIVKLHNPRIGLFSEDLGWH